MFLPSEYYTSSKDYELNKAPDAAAKAEHNRLLVEAGLLRRSWISCQVCRSLWRLGHSMVTTGLRLEQRYGPPVLEPS